MYTILLDLVKRIARVLREIHIKFKVGVLRPQRSGLGTQDLRDLIFMLHLIERKRLNSRGVSMLGDILIIKPQHTKAAQEILEVIHRNDQEKMIIAIGGESGSGKTEVAHELGRALKERRTPGKIMHIDNYYKIPPPERNDWRKAHGVESVGYTEYDWKKIERNIQDFHEDRDQVTMPCIDLITDQVDQLQTSFQGLQYLIIEGLYAVKAEADLRVLIDLTYHETKYMQYARGKEPVNDFRWQVLEREHQVVQSLRPLTNLLITQDFQVKELQ